MGSERLSRDMDRWMDCEAVDSRLVQWAGMCSAGDLPNAAGLRIPISARSRSAMGGSTLIPAKVLSLDAKGVFEGSGPL